MPASTTRYLEHLTEDDLALLAATVGDEVRDPLSVERALADPRVFHAVFGSPFDEPGSVTLAPASPFLVFAVAVHRAATDLQTEAYIEERISAHQRLPVFDVAPLREVGDDPESRLFMVELLGSFTRGSVDPIELARFLELVPASERAGATAASATSRCSCRACSPITPRDACTPSTSRRGTGPVPVVRGTAAPRRRHVRAGAAVPRGGHRPLPLPPAGGLVPGAGHELTPGRPAGPGATLGGTTAAGLR